MFETTIYIQKSTHQFICLNPFDKQNISPLVVGALTNEVAAALLSVMKPCERRARPSCRGKKNKITVGTTEDDSPQSEQPKPVCSMDDMDDDVEIVEGASQNQKGWIIFVGFLVPTFPSFLGSPALRGGTDFANDIEGHLEQGEASRF